MFLFGDPSGIDRKQETSDLDLVLVNPQGSGEETRQEAGSGSQQK